MFKKGTCLPAMMNMSKIIKKDSPKCLSLVCNYRLSNLFETSKNINSLVINRNPGKSTNNCEIQIINNIILKMHLFKYKNNKIWQSHLLVFDSRWYIIGRILRGFYFWRLSILCTLQFSNSILQYITKKNFVIYTLWYISKNLHGSAFHNNKFQKRNTIFIGREMN